MDPERWARVERLLDAALDLPAAERPAFLQRECPDDPALRAEVLEILEAGEEPAPLLDRPAAQVAAVVSEAAGDTPVPIPERVGPYRIERVIGEGGMGTVFLAHRDDGHFDQQVALKLVRRGPHLDARIVRRFRDERQILAALQHPGIARLLDGGIAEDGLPFFAMEYVEGEPITRYCESRSLGVEERLSLFARVCEALAHAHAKGIVHRDIKPSNILVTAEGHPRLLDFGIAKLLVPDDAFPGAALTRQSERLLTPEYASPEQIKGEPVGIAADVYCLGVLLYELLTGQRPFRRSERTAHELERAVLEEDPTRPSDAARGEPLRRRLKGDLDAIVLTAMNKEPERRYRGAAELAADVRRHLAGQPVSARSPSAAYLLRRWVKRHRIAVASAAAGVALTAVTATLVARARAPDLLITGAARRVTLDPELELDPALSPDGRRLAFVGGNGTTMWLQVKDLASGQVTRLAENVEGFHRVPRWSSDGTRLLFQSGPRIYEARADGGGGRLVVGEDGATLGVWSPEWSPDGVELAYVRDGRIRIRNAAGGAPRELPWRRGEPHSLAWSPDGRFLAFVVGNTEFVLGKHPWTGTVNLGNAGRSSVWILPLAGGEAVEVTDDRALNTSPVWMPDGRSLLFVSNRDGDRDVYRVRLDSRGRPAAAPSRLTTGLGAHSIALASDGSTLAYSVFRTISNIRFAEAAPGASHVPVVEVTRGTQSIEGLALSRDGSWLVFDSDRSGNQDIYRMPATGGEPEAVTAGPADEFMPHWSADGREIAFHVFDPRLTRRLEVVAASGGPPTPVTAAPRNQRSPAWSPDGRSLVFDSRLGGQASQLYVVSRTGGGWGAPRRLAEGSAGRWSPDGRHILYVHRGAIWVTDTAGGPGHRVLQVDAETMLGNAEWSPEGTRILFKQLDRAGCTSFASVPASGGTPQILARLDAGIHSHRPEFATDGRRFYFTVTERLSDIWTMELKEGTSR